MKKLIIVLSILIFWHHEVFAGSKATNSNTLSIETVLPIPVLMLCDWPKSSTLSGNQSIDPEDKIALAPRKQSWDWIARVLHKSWVPPKNTRMFFLRKEIDGRDVTRVTWSHGDYRLEVSQTASIFVIRVVSYIAKTMDGDVNRRFETSRQICRQIFNNEGKMWYQDSSGARSFIVVDELNEKIADFSFDVTKIKQAMNNKMIVGQAKSERDEGISPFHSSEENMGNVTPDIKSSESWCYWFRNVGWLNDGQSVSFFFLKINGPGAWIPSYGGETDKDWFREPRDRLGRPISITGK